MADEEVLPVEVHTQALKAANLSQAGRYDNGVNGSCECPEDKCCCMLPKNLFHNLIVTNLDSLDVSSNQMKAATMKHLKVGKGFLEVQHKPDAVNE